jgi:hypothetical protein
VSAIDVIRARIADASARLDGLKAQVAQMAANTTYVIKPTAIYIDPILGDYIDREAKAAQITFDKVEVTAGVWVRTIQTQVGPLPLIADPFLSAILGLISRLSRARPLIERHGTGNAS